MDYIQATRRWPVLSQMRATSKCYNCFAWKAVTVNNECHTRNNKAAFIKAQMGFIYQMRVKGKALVYNALKGRAGKNGRNADNVSSWIIRQRGINGFSIRVIKIQH